MSAMNDKRSVKKRPEPEDRTYHDEVDVAGVTMTSGQEFRMTGSRERYVFTRLVVTDKHGSWVEAVDSRKRSRAFFVDKIAKVLPRPKAARS